MQTSAHTEALLNWVIYNIYNRNGLKNQKCALNLNKVTNQRVFKKKKKFLKVGFNILHQSLPHNLPPEVTFILKKGYGKKKTKRLKILSPCLEDRTICEVNEA